MPPDSTIGEDEQYASSEDSDFSPDAVADQESNHSDSEDDADKTGNKRSKPAEHADAEDAGYNNSGDEAVIEKGKKRRKRAKTKGDNLEDDEGGEGGLIKTRRQRAAEKEERRYHTNTGPVTVDVDAIWAQMLAGKPAPKTTEEQRESVEQTGSGDKATENGSGKQNHASATSNGDTEDMIRIKRTYNFAGKVYTEEKLVARDSAEAKLFLASQGEQVPDDGLPTKRATRKAFRSAFEPLTDLAPQRGDLNLGMAARMKAGKDAQAKKLNTVEKSRMDWAGYVDKEGIQEELALAGKSKDSYTARKDFLARSEARREEDSRRVRLSGRV